MIKLSIHLGWAGNGLWFNLRNTYMYNENHGLKQTAILQGLAEDVRELRDRKGGG